MGTKDLLSTRIYKAIKKDVLDGVYPLGEKINENLLAKTLFVSRTPVHNALKALHKEGLLGYNRNVGYYSNIVCRQDITEIYAIRLVFDTLAAYQASLNMQEEDFLELERMNEEAIRVLEEKADTVKLHAVARDFNAKISFFSGMSRLTSLQNIIFGYLEGFKILYFRKSMPQCLDTIKDRCLIVKAMRTRKRDLIEQAIKNYLDRISENIISFLPDSSKSASIFEAETFSEIKALAQEQAEKNLSEENIV